MKCCETNDGKGAHEEKQRKLTELVRLGIIGTTLTCLVCFTPLAVTLLAVIGLARWAGYLDYILFPLLAVFVGVLMVGLIRRQPDGKQTGGI